MQFLRNAHIHTYPQNFAVQQQQALSPCSTSSLCRPVGRAYNGCECQHRQLIKPKLDPELGPERTLISTFLHRTQLPSYYHRETSSPENLPSLHAQLTDTVTTCAFVIFIFLFKPAPNKPNEMDAQIYYMYDYIYTILTFSYNIYSAQTHIKLYLSHHHQARGIASRRCPPEYEAHVRKKKKQCTEFPLPCSKEIIIIIIIIIIKRKNNNNNNNKNKGAFFQTCVCQASVSGSVRSYHFDVLADDWIAIDQEMKPHDTHWAKDRALDRIEIAVKMEFMYVCCMRLEVRLEVFWRLGYLGDDTGKEVEGGY